MSQIKVANYACRESFEKDANEKTSNGFFLHSWHLYPDPLEAYMILAVYQKIDQVPAVAVDERRPIGAR